VTFDSEPEFIPRHPHAVVDNHDPGPASTSHRHVNTTGARIDGILDKFLDGRARPLDYFARSDPADE
jgi:hypothetical protein